MPTVTARPALIDDLPTIVGLLADDIFGQGRENIGPSLHSDYFDSFEAITMIPIRFSSSSRQRVSSLAVFSSASFLDCPGKGHGAAR